MKNDDVGNHICSSNLWGASTNRPIIMKFDMQKVGTKIFTDFFSEIDFGIKKQRYIDSLCYNSLEIPCRTNR